MVTTARRRVLVGPIALAAAAAIAVCAAAAPAPRRIVSTSPSITETLFALGLGDRVVGVSTFCRYPPAVRALPKVGTFLQPDVEAIVRLAPDLVFVHAGPAAAASHLARLGIATRVVGEGTLDGVFATIRAIGAAVDAADRADALVGDLRRRLDGVRASAAARRRARVLIVVGRRPGTLTDLVAVGAGSYLSDVAAIAGGDNVLAGTPADYPRISMETVIRLAPDVIVDVGEMGESPDDAERRREATDRLWRAQRLVRAAQAGRVHAVMDDAFVVPGPRIADVAEAMAEWLGR